MSELTAEEITLVLKALDALKSQAGEQKLVTSLLGVMLAPTKEDRELVMAKERENFEAETTAQQQLQENVDLLRAKFITLRRTLEEQQVVAEAERTLQS